MRRPARRFNLPENSKKMRLHPEEATGARLHRMEAIMDRLQSGDDADARCEDVRIALDAIMDVMDTEFGRITNKYTNCATPLSHLLLLAIGTRMSGWPDETRVQLMETMGTALMGSPPRLIRLELVEDDEPKGLPN